MYRFNVMSFQLFIIVLHLFASDVVRVKSKSPFPAGVVPHVGCAHRIRAELVKYSSGYQLVKENQSTNYGAAFMFHPPYRSSSGR